MNREKFKGYCGMNFFSSTVVYNKTRVYLLIFVLLTGLIIEEKSIAHATTNAAESAAAGVDSDQDGVPDGVECLGVIGSVPVAVVNGSFEAPDLDSTSNLVSKRYGAPPTAAAAYRAFMVDGWAATAKRGESDTRRKNVH